MKANKDQQIMNSLADLMILIGKFQNQLQAHRQSLTLRNDFNPQCLFKYITWGQQEMTRQHLICFMEENNQHLREDQSKLLFSIYGYKQKLSYSDFLNYIFPFDVEAIKTISTVYCKKYIKNDDEEPSQEILAIFLLLILKEIQFLHKFEQLKSQKIGNSSRQSLKKWVKMFKKCIPPSSTGVNSDYVLTFPQLKSILKNLRNLPERKAQPICRRLSLQKQSFIGIDQLEVWIKPWFKTKQQDSHVVITSQTLFDDLAQNIMS